MKNLLNILSVATLVVLLSLSVSCKKDKEAPENAGFSDKIYSIISKPLLDSLRNKGLVINEGTKPPAIEGIYLISPYTLIAPYGPTDPWQYGKVINDYKYRIYDQKNDEVQIDYKQINGTDEGNGLGSFLSGYGNKFSLFAELAGATGTGVTYKHVAVITGEITAAGIKNFQYGFILTQKTGDSYNAELIAVGSSRILVDGDSFAEGVPYFRLGSNNKEAGRSMFAVEKK